MGANVAGAGAGGLELAFALGGGVPYPGAGEAGLDAAGHAAELVVDEGVAWPFAFAPLFTLMVRYKFSYRTYSPVGHVHQKRTSAIHLL